MLKHVIWTHVPLFQCVTAPQDPMLHCYFWVMYWISLCYSLSLSHTQAHITVCLGATDTHVTVCYSSVYISVTVSQTVLLQCVQVLQMPILLHVRTMYLCYPVLKCHTRHIPALHKPMLQCVRIMCRPVLQCVQVLQKLLSWYIRIPCTLL